MQGSHSPQEGLNYYSRNSRKNKRGRIGHNISLNRTFEYNNLNHSLVSVKTCLPAVVNFSNVSTCQSTSHLGYLSKEREMEKQKQRYSKEKEMGEVIAERQGEEESRVEKGNGDDDKQRQQKSSNNLDPHQYFQSYLSNTKPRTIESQQYSIESKVNVEQNEEIPPRRTYQPNGSLSDRLRNLWTSSQQLTSLRTKRHQQMISQLSLSIHSTNKIIQQYHSRAPTSLQHIQQPITPTPPNPHPN